jgi:phage-related protein
VYMPEDGSDPHVTRLFLHAFQKKSPSGIRTAKRDVDLVAERLKTAERDYEEHHGKQES